LVAKAREREIRNDMQWIADHWFELATIALLAVIAINTMDSRWNNATIVEQQRHHSQVLMARQT
jgi:hypothetical protein